MSDTEPESSTQDGEVTEGTEGVTTGEGDEEGEAKKPKLKPKQATALALKAIENDDQAKLDEAIGNFKDVNDCKKPLLMVAVRAGAERCVALLLDKGARFHEIVDGVLAPIHEACKWPSIFKRLVERGAGISQPDQHEKGPIFHAVDANAEEVVNYLLAKDVSIARVCVDSRTPLHDAAERGFYGICEALLEKGAFVNAKNWNGVTPLLLAAMFNRLEVVELLLERGAEIDWRDNDGRTALHHAARHGHGDVAKLLIASGCDHMLLDKEGLKGCEVAAEPLRKELIDFVIATLMLKSRGIRLSETNYLLCVFCQDVEAVYLFRPCEHISLCAKCLEEHRGHLKFCPMCRKTLTVVEKIPGAAEGGVA